MSERRSLAPWRMMSDGGSLNFRRRVFENPGEEVVMGGRFLTRGGLGLHRPNTEERGAITEARLKEGVDFHWQCERDKVESEREWRRWRKELLQSLTSILLIAVQERQLTGGMYDI